MSDQPSVNAENPWPGLLSFQEGDSEFFHGREVETEELLRLVRRDRLTVLYGASGLGKTSLLLAGLFPRLRQQDALPVYVRLDYAPGSPSLTAQVIQALERAAAGEGIEPPETAADGTLWEYFHRLTANFWTARNRLVLPVIVLDQFEEILTLGRSAPERAAAGATFLEELSDLVEGRPPDVVTARLEQNPDEAEGYAFDRHHYRVVLSLREDFLPELDSLRTRMGSLDQNRLRLRRLSGEQALRVMTESGAQLLTEGAAEGIVRFVAGGRAATPLPSLEVEPSLLSLVCRELNGRRIQRQQTHITLGLLEGTRAEILTDFYERSLEGLSPAVRTLIEERMLTRSGYRDSMAYEDVLAVPDITDDAIRRLVDGRLLRMEDRGGVHRIELTHDVLAGVVQASRDDRRLREERERASTALAEAQSREAATRLQLRRNRTLMFSAGAIAVATFLAIAISMLFVVPVIQAASWTLDTKLYLFTRIWLRVFEGLSRTWWLLLLGFLGFQWIRRKRGKLAWRQIMVSWGAPMLALATIIGLAWIVAISIEYSEKLPRFSEEVVESQSRRAAGIERFFRTGNYDGAGRAVRVALSDTNWVRDLSATSSPIPAYYFLLLAESYRLAGYPVSADSAYTWALTAARSYRDTTALTWERLINESRSKPLEQLRR